MGGRNRMGVAPMWEFMNKAPPWLVAMVVIGTSGGGGAGIVSLLQPNVEIKKSLDKIDETLDRVNTTLNNYDWRLRRSEDRLDGARMKNIDQDKELRVLRDQVTRLDALSGKL